MGNALAGIGTPSARSVGGARDAASASTDQDGATPFADVMQAQDQPAAPPECAPAGRRAAGADAGRERPQDEPAVDEVSATPAADDGSGDLDAPGVDALLELCAAPTVDTAAEAGRAGATADAALPTVLPTTLPVQVAVPAPPAPAQDPAASLREGIGSTTGAGLPGLGPVATDVAPGTAGIDPDADGGSPEGGGDGGALDSPTLPSGTAAAEGRVATRPGSADATARPPELRAPLGTPAWTDELGSRVTWMLERGEQVASLRLSPENLGPLEVRIAVREGETTVWFGATQADTRAALEQSLPRLREMLGAAGLSLANAGVFSQTPRDPQRGFTAAALARASQESGAEAPGATVTGITGRGLVDLYA
jgi:flagellar hook-length control protein FliK